MWHFVRQRWFLSIRCIPFRLRWSLPDMLYPWRKLWSHLISWSTYRSRNLLYPGSGVQLKDIIDRPGDCQHSNTILQWLEQVDSLEFHSMEFLQTMLDAGFSKEECLQLLDLRTKLRKKSCEQVLSITQALDSKMVAFGNVEFTALIQGLRVRNDGNSYSVPRTVPIFEKARETAILHRTCRS